MRYTRKQLILSVVADETIDDVNSIREIIESLKDTKTDASISYRRDKMDPPTSHDRIRIDSCTDKTFDITILNQTYSMSVKKIPYECVDSLCSTVMPSDILRKKAILTKGDVLDLA